MNVEPLPLAKLLLAVEIPARVKPSVCKGCGATICWLTNRVTGKHMCFDQMVERPVEGQPGDWGIELAGNHWATCPKAKEFKR